MNDTNEVVGSFMCQGKMPQAVRDKYNKLKKEVPNQGAHYDLMISNFDKALSHPDEKDLEGLKAAVLDALKKTVRKNRENTVVRKGAAVFLREGGEKDGRFTGDGSDVFPTRTVQN